MITFWIGWRAVDIRIPSIGFSRVNKMALTAAIALAQNPAVEGKRRDGCPANPGRTSARLEGSSAIRELSRSAVLCRESEGRYVHWTQRRTTCLFL